MVRPAIPAVKAGRRFGWGRSALVASRRERPRLSSKSPSSLDVEHRDGPLAAGGASLPSAGWIRSMDRLLDQSTQPFAIASFDGRLVYTNRAFQELMGYTAEELRGLTYRDITADRFKDLSEPALERLRRDGKAQRYEKAYVARDGREIPVEIVTDLYRDEQDRPIGYFAFITDIGERKRSEQALRDSEERFRRLYDEAPFGYHEIAPDGTILMVNRTECEMLGYTREELIGRPIFDLMAPADREKSREAVRRRIAGDEPVASVERTYYTKDGRPIVVAIENRLTRDAQGNVTSIRSTVQDITWRKQAEAALVASERRMRALFEGIEDAVFVHDLDGRILDANPSACRRLGYTRDELLRLRTADIDDPGFAAGYEDRLAEQLKHGHLRIEGRHRTKAGRIIPVDINTSTIQFEDQKVVLAVIRDITERKALEETRRQFAEAQLKNAWEIEAKNRALMQSEARYRQLTEGCRDAIVVADQGGNIVVFNPAAQETFGYAASEAIGQPLTLLIPETFREAHKAGFARYVSTREARVVGRTIELRGRRKSGEEFPLEIALSAVEVAGELQFIGAIRDQTERQRMRAMLMQSEKLASIGLLSAGLAHEINNPLAYIGNNLAVLERDSKGILEMMAAYESAAETLPDDVRQRVRSISEELDWPYVRENLSRMLARTREGVQRVATIVNNLRGLARRGPTKMESALLSDLVAGAIEMAQGRLRRGHIEVRFEDGARRKLPCVPSQIGQVILNMLVNSIQAIESSNRVEGGVVRIVTRETAEEQFIEFHDNGCGIPEDVVPQLFDPFFTTKPVGEGTGLGLSISHGIITGHGGRIEVESKPGEGTCFRVCLPLNPA
jgi:two-component system NtrC family sensor kinase